MFLYGIIKYLPKNLLENVIPKFKNHHQDEEDNEQNNQRTCQPRYYRKLLFLNFIRIQARSAKLRRVVSCGLLVERLVDIEFALQTILMYFTSRASLL